MTTTVTLTGTRLQVNGENVRKDWGFTRKGASVNPVVYVVTRWGRTDVTFQRRVDGYGSTAGRRDLTGFTYTRGGSYRSEFVMTHAEFARFVEKFYGDTREVGETAQRERHQRIIAEHQQQMTALRQAEAYTEATTMVESIREALDSSAGIYAILDMLYAAREEGFEAGREEGYDSGFDSGRSWYEN